jgi:hypothetical protein
MRQKFLCSLIAVLGLSACDPARTSEETMLVSISGVRLETTQAVYFIGLYMQNLRVRAICHIPTGWTLATGIESRQDVLVEGQASSAVYELKSDSLKELRGLFLVEKRVDEMKGDRGPDYHIDGDLYLDVGGQGPDGTIIPLNSKIVLEPADRCPASGAQRPGGDEARVMARRNKSMAPQNKHLRYRTPHVSPIRSSAWDDRDQRPRRLLPPQGE